MRRLQPVSRPLSTQKADGERASAAQRGKQYRMERQIIAMMLQYQEILPEIDLHSTLDKFEDPDLLTIGRMVMADYHREDRTAADVVDRISDEHLNMLATRLAIGADPWDRRGCLRLLEQYHASRRRRVDPLLAQIKAAEAAGDEQELVRLLAEKQKLAIENN